jgi:hypothetical protein
MARKTSGSSCGRTGSQNRIFKSFDDIVDHCCYAWNTLIDQPWKIMSIARRDWATMGYTLGRIKKFSKDEPSIDYRWTGEGCGSGLGFDYPDQCSPRANGRDRTPSLLAAAAGSSSTLSGVPVSCGRSRSARMNQRTRCHARPAAIMRPPEVEQALRGYVVVDRDARSCAAPRPHPAQRPLRPREASRNGFSIHAAESHLFLLSI